MSKRSQIYRDFVDNEKMPEFSKFKHMSQINAIVSKRLQIYRYFVENEKNAIVSKRFQTYRDFDDN